MTAGELDGRFSSAAAQALDWEAGVAVLQNAPLYWLSTVRADGRPHVTPLMGAWSSDALYFCTGAGEQKAKNLQGNPRCVLTTGSNSLDEGLDVVVEGDAVLVTDKTQLDTIAQAYEEKYGPHTSPDGTFADLPDAVRGGDVLTYRVAPVTAFAFGKGEPFSQTRWRFSA